MFKIYRLWLKNIFLKEFFVLRVLCADVLLRNYSLHHLPSVLRHCWLGIRKSIRPVKIELWGVGVVICLK